MSDEQVLSQILGPGATLPRELQELAGQRPNIVVNHTYNIHYQSDRPTEQHMQDVAAYGREYTQAVNDRCWEICQVPTSSCVDLLCNPEHVSLPELKVVGYYEGATGIPISKGYVPDAKYKKSYVREYKGERIQLEQLHHRIGPNRDQQCRHVALLGNPGCGKTVLCKKYAKMVMNREIPELDDVELVHFIDMRHIVRDDDPESALNDMLLTCMVHVRDNVYKYGYEWIRQNPEKLLLIFDAADKVLPTFSDTIEPINYTTKATLSTIMQNILTNHILRGCRTVVAARDWAWKGLIGNCRPQKVVVIGPMNEEQRLNLVKTICPSEFMGDEFCHNLTRHFPGGFALTKDAMHLYFAVSSLKWGSQPSCKKISTDVMLVVMMLQHVLRSQYSERELGSAIAKIKPIAFDMVHDGVIRLNFHQMKKYFDNDLTHEDMIDLMVVAPQHKHNVYYRLMGVDYSYSFSHQIIQEALAACYVGEMQLDEFKDFVRKLHEPQWLVIRRFVCGVMLHPTIKMNLLYFLKKPSHGAKMEEVLLSSLREQTKTIHNLASYERFELIASLYESGETAKPIIESHLHNMVLPDLVLEPVDLYIISKIEQYITVLNKIDICLHGDIDIEEYDCIASMTIRKGENIRLNLTHLNLTSGHVAGLVRPMKSFHFDSSGKQIHILLSEQTDPRVIQMFEQIPNEVDCSLSIEKVKLDNNMDVSE